MLWRRRASGNDGAYRVLEKLAQQRSVNLGDPSTLGLQAASHSMGPPLTVHRTGSAPPAPGLPQQQVRVLMCRPNDGSLIDALLGSKCHVLWQRREGVVRVKVVKFTRRRQDETFTNHRFRHGSALGLSLPLA